VTLPFGFEWRDIDDNSATRVGGFAETYREDVSWYTKILNRARQRERIRWNDADVTLLVHKTRFIERLRIDKCRFNIGKNLEFIGATNVVAVTRRTVGNDAIAVHFANLPGFEGVD
jgi:hypothetical protein